MTANVQIPWIGVTTDDGAKARGFRCLVADLRETEWHVEAVAPRRGWVSYGTGLGADPMRLLDKPVTHKTKGLEVLDLPPAAVARHICQRANEKGSDPRVRPCVVVGVNHGPNVGDNLIHSGTFGEAVVASWLGLCAVAVSLDDAFSVDEASPGPLRFKEAARIARFAVSWVLSCRRPVLCNINVPNSVRLDQVRIEAALPHKLTGDSINLRLDREVLRQGKVTVTVSAGGSLRVSESLSRRGAHAIATRWQSWLISNTNHRC